MLTNRPEVLMSPAMVRWYWTGMAFAIVAGTFAMLPYHMEHGALLPLSERVLGGFVLFGIVVLVLAIPILGLFLSWMWIVRRWAPTIESSAISRWTALLVLSACSPPLLWGIASLTLMTLGMDVGEVSPWSLRIPGTSLRIGWVWMFIGLPVAAWILLPRLLVPTLRGPINLGRARHTNT